MGRGTNAAQPASGMDVIVVSSVLLHNRQAYEIVKIEKGQADRDEKDLCMKKKRAPLDF